MGRRGLGTAWCVIALLVMCDAVRAATKDSWIEIRPAGYTVLSQVSERKSRDIVRELQIFQAALPYFTTIEDTNPRVPVRIFLLREDAFQEVTEGINDVRGVMFAQPFNNDIVVNAAPPPHISLSLVFHEYVHHALRNGSHVNLPPFYEEGLAQLAQSFQVDGRQARFGILTPEIVRIARKPGHMPLRDVIAVDRSSVNYPDHGSGESFYARSVAFLHYCQLARPERGEQLRNFIDRSVAGAAPLEAFSESFGATPEALDEELDAYLRSGPKLHGVVDVSSLPQTERLTTRKVGEVEANTQYALLRLRVNRGLAGVRELLQSALAAQPESLDVIGGMALLTRADPDPQAPAAWLARLIKGAANDPAWLTRAGFLQLEVIRRTNASPVPQLSSETQQQIRDARALFERALQAQPDRLDAAFGYSVTQTFVPDDVEKAKTIAADALKRLPGSGELKWTLARLQVMTGQAESALTHLQAVACSALDNDIRKLARQEIGDFRCTWSAGAAATSVSLRQSNFKIVSTLPRPPKPPCETNDDPMARVARREGRPWQDPAVRSRDEELEKFGDPCGRGL